MAASRSLETMNLALIVHLFVPVYHFHCTVMTMCKTSTKSFCMLVRIHYLNIGEICPEHIQSPLGRWKEEGALGFLPLSQHEFPSHN